MGPPLPLLRDGGGLRVDGRRRSPQARGRGRHRSPQAWGRALRPPSLLSGLGLCGRHRSPQAWSRALRPPSLPSGLGPAAAVASLRAPARPSPAGPPEGAGPAGGSGLAGAAFACPVERLGMAGSFPQQGQAVWGPQQTILRAHGSFICVVEKPFL